MSKYSFLDELIIVESLAIDLNSALYAENPAMVEDVCRQLRNSANRIIRKLQEYNDFYEHAEIVAGNVHRAKFVNFDKGE